ncbi:MAG: hypothetical protein JSR75_15020 [Proteobacteria bacterium]|nr:hypothetical protein [Pseudomonadota bacterium]
MPRTRPRTKPSPVHEIWLPAHIAPPFGADLWLEILRRLQAYLQGSGIAPWVTGDGLRLSGMRRPIGAFELSLILRWLMDQREISVLGLVEEGEGSHGDGA